MNPEEFEILIRARDEFSQAFKVASRDLNVLEKDIKKLANVERGSTMWAQELARRHGELSTTVNKSAREVNLLNKELRNVTNTQGTLPGFEKLKTNLSPMISQVRQLDEAVDSISPGPVSELQRSFNDLSPKEIKELNREVKNGEGVFKRLRNAVREYTKEQDKANDATKRGKGELKKFEGQISLTKIQTLRFIGALAGVQLGISVLSTTIIGLRRVIIETNAEIEASTLQFTTLMGNADDAKKHIADLYAFAKRTPFSVGPLLEASRTLQTFGGEALNNLRIIELLGNATAATNADIANMTTWVGRLYAGLQNGQPIGEALARLQELAVLTPRARLEIERLVEAGRGSEAFVVFERDLDRFSGALESQSRTWKGAASTAIDGTNVMISQAFNPFFKGVKDLILNYNGWLEVSGEDFASKITAGLSIVRTGFGFIVTSIKTVVNAWKEIPAEIQLILIGWMLLITVAPRVVWALALINSALKAQSVWLLANPWAIAAIAIVGTIIVAMKLFGDETEATNVTIRDQIDLLDELSGKSLEGLEQDLLLAQRVLDQATAQFVIARQAVDEAMTGTTGKREFTQLTVDLNEAEQAMISAQEIVTGLSGDVDFLNGIIENGSEVLISNINDLKAYIETLKAERDALDVINFKLETNQRLTKEEQAALDELDLAVGAATTHLTFLQKALAWLESHLKSGKDAIDDYTNAARELREELLGMSAQSIARGLVLDLADLKDQLDRGSISIFTYVLQLANLYSQAIQTAESVKALQDSVEAYAAWITEVTGLSAKADKAGSTKAVQTAMEKLLESMKTLADSGGASIDELVDRLERYRVIAEEAADVTATNLIDAFFEMEFTISDVNSALGTMRDRFGDLPDEMKIAADAAEALKKTIEALKDAFNTLRSSAVADINMIGGLLETALTRQAKGVLDNIVAGQEAERNALKALSQQSKDIVAGAQIEMTASVHAGTQARIQAILNESNALKTGINAELAEIQRRLDALNTRDFEHSLEMIDREMRLAFDPREMQKLLDKREQLVRREEQDQLKERQKALQDQLKTEETTLVDEFKAIIDDRTAVLDRAKEQAQESFEEATDAFNLQSKIRTMLLNGEVDEMGRLLDAFVPEWRTAGLSYGEQLIDGIRSSGIEAFLQNMLGNLGNVQAGIPGITGGGPGSSRPGSSVTDVEIAAAQVLGARLVAEGGNLRTIQHIRDAIIEQGAIPSFREGGFARTPTLAIVGDRPGGEHIFGNDQLRQVIREEVKQNVGVRVFIGDRELTDIVRVEIENENDFQMGRGARLAGGRT